MHLSFYLGTTVLAEANVRKRSIICQLLQLTLFLTRRHVDQPSALGFLQQSLLTLPATEDVRCATPRTNQEWVSSSGV
ncbi:hypothetical protein JTE90_021737 [Oedothorax gibbosus]|uniref:Uncharacterized protein n=1 Tax=Oedothorax gibbosus TaxID=931172 RepID=A0AAV6UEU5_9ARAC|nr:hypothetical protein JTE90_021737 [Oedothorax gibbosus]